MVEASPETPPAVVDSPPAQVPAAVVTPRRVAPAKKPKLPADAVRLGSSYYKMYPGRLSWHQAKIACERLGGHLAIVQSRAENGFLTALARQGGAEDVWLGATDEEVEGSWRWVNGSAMSFNAWDPRFNQPNNGSGRNEPEHFLILRAARAGLWWDAPDDGEYLADLVVRGYICQWDAGASGAGAAR